MLKSITNVNPESSFSVKATAEIAKFQLHTFVDYNSTHAGKIDVLSLEYEYWNLPDNSTNPTTCDRAAEYQNHKNILTAMQIIKDNSTYPLLVEDYLADFSNTLLTASGPCQVTETTQVEELDWLSDRILLTTYNAYTANLFTRNCKRLQLLGRTLNPIRKYGHFFCRNKCNNYPVLSMGSEFLQCPTRKCMGRFWEAS